MRIFGRKAIRVEKRNERIRQPGYRDVIMLIYAKIGWRDCVQVARFFMGYTLFNLN